MISFLVITSFSSNQSGFRSGDSCINQLLSINHKMLNEFDEGLEISGIFLDISKAFDEIWPDFLSCIKMVYAEILSTFYKIFFATENEE